VEDTALDLRSVFESRAPVSLDDSYSRSRPNSLNFIRWVLAAAVIFYHGYIIAAMSRNPLSRNLNVSPGPTAVLGFFLLSGFLISRSVKTSSSFGNYLWRRIIRIFPGYWVCLIVTAFVIGPLSWLHANGTLHGYRAAKPWLFVWDNKFLKLNRPAINGVFTQTRMYAVTHSIPTNGSLWTLRYEFICYVVVGVLGVVGLLWTRRVFMLCLTALVGLVLLMQAVVTAVGPASPQLSKVLGPALLDPFSDPNVLRFFFAFFVGACFALYAERIIIDDRLGLASFAAFLLIARWHGPTEVLGALPMLYAMLWLGQRMLIPVWDRIGDPSYGVYVYGWPVQALLAEYGLHRALGIQLYIVISILVSTIIGLLSWHLIEKQALKMKRFDPGRSLRSLVRRLTAPKPPEPANTSPLGYGDAPTP
jgi:peptidoglycan/LPS O-acetylase OafA/YrhL